MRVIVSSQILRTDALKECVETLRHGGILCYPTETFYALGVDPWNSSARTKLYALKARNEEKELPLIAASEEMVARFCRTDHPLYSRLAKRFWPGPLTLVLPAISGTGSFAVRLSSHPLAMQLSEAFGGPLVSTSANKSGESPVQSLVDLAESIARGVDIGIDSGATQGGKPSTILSLLQEEPDIIREGSIPSENLL